MNALPRRDDDRELADALRLAMRRMAASVCVITTRDEAGRGWAMTATAVTSLSMDPPTMLACINHRSMVLAPIRGGAPFCINVLEAGQRAIAEQCSRAELKTEGFLDRAPWVRGAFELPYLPEAQAAIFCQTERTIAHSTHDIVIGRVAAVQRHGEVAPLVYLDSRYIEGV
ncbi:MAG: flavin oxidoreductase [Gammaproteobacteria bacterium]|nr:MAG: flavin oxidoreductase [Gammaproteobacteria bacterium]